MDLIKGARIFCNKWIDRLPTTLYIPCNWLALVIAKISFLDGADFPLYSTCDI